MHENLHKNVIHIFIQIFREFLCQKGKFKQQILDTANFF